MHWSTDDDDDDDDVVVGFLLLHKTYDVYGIIVAKGLTVVIQRVLVAATLCSTMDLHYFTAVISCLSTAHPRRKQVPAAHPPARQIFYGGRVWLWIYNVMLMMDLAIRLLMQIATMW